MTDISGPRPTSGPSDQPSTSGPAGKLLVTQVVPALTMLDEAVGDYAAAARAANTWRAYRSDYAGFERWCAHQSPALEPLPASPLTLARYLAAHATTHRPATLARWCSSITAAHAVAGYPSPALDPQVRTVLSGIKRVHAAGLEQLRAIVALLDSADPRDARDRALILIGFAGALRRSELAALTLADLVVDHDGLRVRIVSSKTDPTAVGHTRGLAYGAHADTCPIRAWQTWRSHRLREMGTATDTGSGPAALAAFAAIDRWGTIRGGLSPRTIARIIAARAAAAGLSGHWAGHSLRRGFATAAYAAGTPEIALMRHGRWRSNTAMRGYIDEGTVWMDNPTRSLGL